MKHIINIVNAYTVKNNSYISDLFGKLYDLMPKILHNLIFHMNIYIYVK